MAQIDDRPRPIRFEGADVLPLHHVVRREPGVAEIPVERGRTCESLCGRRVGHRSGDRTARFDRRFERAIKCRHEAPAPEAPVVPAAALAMRASWPRLGAAATRECWYLLPTLREDASPLTGWWRRRVHRADDPRRTPLELRTRLRIAGSRRARREGARRRRPNQRLSRRL